MGKNFNGTQINGSQTIVLAAGEAIPDCRNRLLKINEEGAAVLATAGTDLVIGVALIEAGMNDITGRESGKVEKGDDIDILVKDIGYVLAGGEIKKGAEVAAGSDGLAATAKDGDSVFGIALSEANEGEYCCVLVSRYKKGAAAGAAAAAATKLSDLTDVEIGSPEKDQVLTYDDQSSKWKNKNAASEAV